MPAIQGYLTTTDGIRLLYQKVGTGGNTVVVPNATYMFDDFKYLAKDRTIVFYDLRNRGRSDAVSDASKLKGGIHNDIADLEAVREHFGADKIDVIGHSYLGFVVAFYAMKHPEHVKRVVQIGSAQPFAGKQYPPHLTGADATAAEINAKLMELQKEGPAGDPEGFGARVCALMRQLYVTNPADAGKIKWSVAHLPNESLPKLMTYYSEYLLPSMQGIQFTPVDFGRANMPILTIHGTRDRHAPYGGGRDWALMLPDARLITVENAAHLPWIEAPEKVFGSIRTFLDGTWPDVAKRVTDEGGQ